MEVIKQFSLKGINFFVYKITRGLKNEQVFDVYELGVIPKKIGSTDKLEEVFVIAEKSIILH